MEQQTSIQTEALAILRWYEDAGVTDIVGENIIDFSKADFPSAVFFLNRKKPNTEKSTVVAPVSKPSLTIELDDVKKPVTNNNEALGTAEASLEARELASNANTLEELQKALEGFTGSGLEKMATNMVFADGNPKAKIMLVGEAPAADEDRIGKPFAGVQGQLLDKMLAAIGLDRETVYLTNVINWRPPGNRTPSASEIAICLPFIKRHIELVKPEILIYLGGVSAKALLETSQGITRLRGKWMDYESDALDKTINSMAIFHPTYLLHSPAQKKLAWHDLLVVKERLQQL